ncbi:MAG: LysR family transcriptional regulator [Anaerostipes sp.]
MRDSDWKILEVLYEKRSITQTAELLYMTQPSVTKRIKAMEEEWQIEIVKRSNRGVIFTERRPLSCTEILYHTRFYERDQRPFCT